MSQVHRQIDFMTHWEEEQADRPKNHENININATIRSVRDDSAHTNADHHRQDNKKIESSSSSAGAMRSRPRFDDEAAATAAAAARPKEQPAPWPVIGHDMRNTDTGIISNVSMTIIPERPNSPDSTITGNTAAAPEVPVVLLVDNFFLHQVEQLDGMKESLRLLLGAATAAGRREEDMPQDQHLDEEEENKARCKRYGFTLSSPLKRRRIFWGSLIADDSWHVLGLASMEYYGLFDTIAFVESNTTQSLFPRSLRFPPGSARKALLTSPLLWGNTTRVHVDYFWDDENSSKVYHKMELARENDQRNYIFQRWKKNGMTENDIGFLSDTDEIANRDFLKALQVCNVPEFFPAAEESRGNTPSSSSLTPARPHDCLSPKVGSSSIVFEGSPKCMQVPRRWYHPEFLIGACIQGIGNDTLRDVSARKIKSAAYQRVFAWRNHHVRHIPWVSSSTTNGTTNTTTTTTTTVPLGPLWDATDMRMMAAGGRRAEGIQNGARLIPTGYHFHNFFDSLSTLRNKYFTYGHRKKAAMEVPLSAIHPNDVGFMVTCLTGRSQPNTTTSKWRQPKPSDWDVLDPVYATPVAFQKVPNYVALRHKEFQDELAADELLHPPH